MELKQTIPEALIVRLKEVGITEDEILLSIESDIDLLGRYDPQWVLATQKGIWVLSEPHPTEPATSLGMERISEFRTLAAVGSGILQAKVDGIWIDLVRYSNRRKYWFDRLAKRLEQVRQGLPIEFEEEDGQDPRRCSSCGLMLQFPGETCPRCINRGVAVGRVLQLMFPYWRLASIMMTLLLCGIGLDMVGPLLTRYLVDNILRVGNGTHLEEPEETETVRTDEPVDGTPPPMGLRGRFSSSSLKMKLLFVVIALASIQAVRVLVTLLNGRLASRVGTSITYDIRGRLLKHLERLGLSFYDKQQVGSLVGRVAYDTEAVHGFMSQLTAGFFMQILLVVFSSILMFSLSSSLAIWTLIPAPFVMMGSMFFYRFVYPRYHRFYDRSSKQAGMLSGILSGIRVVKSFAQEDRELERFQTSSGALRDARRRVDASAATFYPLMGLVFQAGGWVVWYVGGGRVLGENLSLGTLMAFFGYLGMFYGPLASLTNLTTWLTQFTTQTHRIFEILDTPISIPESREKVPLPKMKGRIEFRNVTFGYSRQTPVLRDVSFEIPEGQSLGIVGRSGSGKTTIINLISRFYDVDEGRILLDGIDVRKVPLHDLRRQVGVVLQEPFLFRGTLWDNLVYGQETASEEQVIAASRASNAHDFVLRQHHGYDTWVGERGAGLSGGERQRISIARALICDPQVLILDEATSSVDSESELAIQNALAELIKGRTSIIIAHRLSTLRFCDTIIVIEDGRLAERGTHTDLMKRDGKYARFVRLQSAVSSSSSVDQLAEAEGQSNAQEAKRPPVTPDPRTGLPRIDSHHARWLSSQIAQIEVCSLGSLLVTIENEGTYQGVFAVRCMPIRHPARYISLRYQNPEDREQEIGLIRDLKDWPEPVQKILWESLLRRYFVHTITRIRSIQQFQNFLTFSVETDLGPMEFILRYTRDSALDFGEGGKLLLDVEENRYAIPNVDALAEKDRRVFERYIYW